MTRVTATLLVAILCASGTGAAAQPVEPDGSVAAVDLSGLDWQELSRSLREDLVALEDGALDRDLVASLARRIESERPDTVVATRVLPEGDQAVRVVFLVARIEDDRRLTSNINARYVVERVDVRGVDPETLDDGLRDALEALEGRRLDPDEAERLEARLEDAFPNRLVSQRITRGSEPGRIRLVFRVRLTDDDTWLEFAPSQAGFRYHSELTWSGALDIAMGSRHHRVNVIGIFDDRESLVERFSGYRLRVESRRVGSGRLGLGLEFSDLNPSWEDQTLVALAEEADAPPLYSNRRAFSPSVRFAVTPFLWVGLGATVTELDPLFGTGGLEVNRTRDLSAGLDHEWDLGTERHRETHRLQARYDVQTRTDASDGAPGYTRRLVEASYRHDHGRNTLIARVRYGRITGTAPLFERFTLGNSDTGESGTGKELLAAHIHEQSRLADRPFIKVNCAAIPTELVESELFGHEKGAFTGATAPRRGKFELADGGTIFLDEVGDLQEAAQAKLLRVLQDGELQRLGGERPITVSVRVISATNRPLERMIADGRFREDLFYRLSVVPIRIPALRERVEDVPELARYFLQEFCRRNGFKPKTIDDTVFPLLAQHRWPGNVRELRNAIERIAILTPGDHIEEAALPDDLRRSSTTSTSGLLETRNDAERDRIRQVLDATGWNVSAAARQLGVERTGLHKRMRALGLKREDR